jgi:hypothetical protein
MVRSETPGATGARAPHPADAGPRREGSVADSEDDPPVEQATSVAMTATTTAMGRAGRVIETRLYFPTSKLMTPP